jgi:predicted phosphodiesterase
MTLRVALIADIHHGEDSGTKLGTAALPLLARFREFVAEAGPDLVIELGDRINDVDPETDRRLTRDVVQAFAPMNTRRAHLLGNHDNHALARAEAEAAMGVSFASWSCDIEGHHFVFWNAETCLLGRDGFELPEADLAWLAEDLACTDMPTIVSTHVPLDSGSMIGNYYFESRYRGFAHYRNGDRAREILERSGKVVLCLAGHAHWNALNTIDGIPYVTVQSLTESFTTPGRACGAFGLLEIDEAIDISILGLDPVRLRLPLRRLGSHWHSPTRDFAPPLPAPIGAVRA